MQQKTYIIVNKKAAKENGILPSVIWGMKWIYPSYSDKEIYNLLGINYRTYKKANILGEFPEGFSKLPHWKLSIEDIKELGINKALVLAHIKDLYYVFQKPFFQTHEDFVRNLGISKNQVNDAISELKKRNLIVITPGKLNRNVYMPNAEKTVIESKKIKNVGKYFEMLKERKQKMENKKLEITREDLLENYEKQDGLDVISFYRTIKIKKPTKKQTLDSYKMPVDLGGFEGFDDLTFSDLSFGTPVVKTVPEIVYVETNKKGKKTTSLF